ncbi:hypothetical protein ACHAWX_000982 [Stephanocyclus meneghinianus]
MYATCIGDILKKFAYASSSSNPKPCIDIAILGDVTYGACCIDDLTAQSLDCDLLVHYGHSCLVPTTLTVVPCLYVFVEIRVDVRHLVECVRLTFYNEFRSAVVEAARLFNQLNQEPRHSALQFQAIVPQAKPLSPGEVLGCTAPKNATPDDAPSHTSHQATERVMIFVADGRFHLEAAMIANPSLRALRYDPYSKTLTEERYEIAQMKRLRREAVQRQPKTMGIILGTLGRQGNPGILARIRLLLRSRGIRVVIVLLSEIFPKKIHMLSGERGGGRAAAASGVCAWVQIACPRLSIDWGHYFCVPVLSPFELFVALGEVPDSSSTGDYPMDFYSKNGGPWTNYFESNNARRALSCGQKAQVSLLLDHPRRNCLDLYQKKQKCMHNISFGIFHQLNGPLPSNVVQNQKNIGSNTSLSPSHHV